MNPIRALRDFLRGLVRVALLVSAATLAACGGGGDQFASGGIVGTGDAGVIAVGTISAFGPGSITVNGVRYTTATATVRFGGQPAAATALKLGMVVTVQGGATQPDGSVPATSVDYRPEVQGVVSGVDSASQAFTVLGQRVRTDRQTVFDGGTFATLVGQYVEVSGFRSSPGEMLATLVQIRPSVPPGAPLAVTGAAAQLDSAARSFFVGAQLVDYTQVPAALVPPGLANGVVVKAQGTMVGAGDRLFATTIELVATTLPAPEASNVELEGIVSGFANLGNFRVNGQLVDGRGATFEGGSAAALADGIKVEVEGRLTQGVVVATKIEIEEDATVTLDGLAEAVDASGGAVTVSSQRVATTQGTQFQDSSAAALRNFGLAAIAVGDRLSIRATHGAAGLVATRIERLDRSAPGPTQPDASAEGVISEFLSIADFKVGGRSVNASSATFAGGTAADLANGRRVEADGVLSGTILLATRITFKVDDPAAPGSVDIEGTIAGFVSAANFVVAGQRIDATGAAFDGGTAASLANGVRVEVVGTLVNGVLVARTVSVKAAPTDTTLEVEGQISNFVSIANFTVSGQHVDASKATIKNGSAADLANGRKCHVKGTVIAGVLVAITVELEDAPELQGASAKGQITNFVSASNFKVGGRSIDASGAKFEGGTAANLANGVQVEVEGKLVGTVLKADKVAFAD